MGLSKTIWANLSESLRTQRPDAPVMFFSPTVLQATARRFGGGFPGMVTYAVKSNPEEMVIQNLVAAGVKGFDVASPAEIEMVARLATVPRCTTTTRSAPGMRSPMRWAWACAPTRSTVIRNCAS